jgi:hypothetical protein
VIGALTTLGVVAVLAYVLPQLVGPKAKGPSREVRVPHASVQDPDPVFEEVLEQRLCRCDVCGHAYVLSYERTIRVGAGDDTTVREHRVTCGRASCRHGQAVVVPMTSRNHRTSEWFGAEEPMSAAPSLRAIQDGQTQGGERGRPTRA